MKTLIIDEISMLSGDTFAKLEALARLIRKSGQILEIAWPLRKDDTRELAWSLTRIRDLTKVRSRTYTEGERARERELHTQRERTI